MKNTFKALFVLILALVSVTFVTAADFSINRVDVNGITVSQTGSAVHAERGTTVPVTIFYTGNPGAKVAYDTRVKVYVGGYEYGDIEAVSHIFATHPNVTDQVTVNLKLPADMKATDTYTLHVQMFDDDQNVPPQKYTLFIKEARHDVSIYDVILNPFNNVQAGQPLFVTVRLENMGDNVEDSIKVTASIPTLGVQTSEYVDELVRTRDENQNNKVLTKNDATTTNELVLMIPENAKNGEYELKVKLDYNRGYGRDAKSGSDEKVMKVQIKGAKAEVVQPLVSVDSASQKAALGAGAAFKVSLGNPSSEARTYSVQVSGVDSWGTARVDPQTVTVAADKVGEAVVYVSPSESAQLGVRNFVVSVKDQAGNLVGEKTLSLEVVQGSASTVGFETFKEVLKVGFIVLLVVLVILGIVLVAKRLGGKEESVEGQTYYQ